MVFLAVVDGSPTGSKPVHQSLDGGPTQVCATTVAAALEMLAERIRLPRGHLQRPRPVPVDPGRRDRSAGPGRASWPALSRRRDRPNPARRSIRLGSTGAEHCSDRVRPARSRS